MDTKIYTINKGAEISIENILYKPLFIFYTLFFYFFTAQFLLKTVGYYELSLDIKGCLNLLFLGYYLMVTFGFTYVLFKKTRYAQAFFSKTSIVFIGGILLLLGQITIC